MIKQLLFSCFVSQTQWILLYFMPLPSP